MTGPPARGIAFTKASACGNDFLIVAGEGVAGDLAVISRRMCDRHHGIGADGVEWLFPDADADTRALLYNADGSEAEVSGNGTRCIAAWLSAQSGKSEVLIRTGAGLKRCRLTGRKNHTFEFEADMGAPVLGGETVVTTPGAAVAGTKVSMGNPHFVIFGESFPERWQHEAGLIAAQREFPEGTNVEYVVVRGANEIEIRLFERGVGETLSSGTGSCAAAVAAIDRRSISSPVRVVAPGGAQTVRWDGSVFLQGPATLICRGEFFV